MTARCWGTTPPLFALGVSLEHEAGEFEDDDVGGADGGEIEEEGFADVAAEENTTG